MAGLNRILEEARKSRDDPKMFLKKFQEVFEEYRENAIFLFEYVTALDFMGNEAEAIPLYQKAIKLGLSGKIKTQTEIQLGSSLSVIGANESAIAILSRVQ